MKSVVRSVLVILGLGYQVLSTQYFAREDFLQPEFDWSQLEVEEQFLRNNQECHFVREEVTVFKYMMLDNEGKPINSTVAVARGFEVDIRTFYDDRQPYKPGKHPAI